MPQVLEANSLEFSSRSVVSMCNTGNKFLKKHTSFVGSFDERPVHMFFSAPVFVVSLCQRTFHSSGSLKGGVVFFLSVSSMFT